MVNEAHTALSIDDLLRARDMLLRNDENYPPHCYVVTGRHARVVLGMPGRLINKARIEPQQWNGHLWKVIGL